MIRPSGAIPDYLHGEPVDMRKSNDGLAALVEQDMDGWPGKVMGVGRALSGAIIGYRSLWRQKTGYEAFCLSG